MTTISSTDLTATLLTTKAQSSAAVWGEDRSQQYTGTAEEIVAAMAADKCGDLLHLLRQVGYPHIVGCVTAQGWWPVAVPVNGSHRLPAIDQGDAPPVPLVLWYDGLWPDDPAQAQEVGARTLLAKQKREDAAEEAGTVARRSYINKSRNLD